MLHNLRLLRAILLACAFVGALMACAGAPAGLPAVDRFEQTVDGLTVTLELPAGLRLNQSLRLTAALGDAAGAPVEAADVYFDLQMPEHPMGTNAPVATSLGDGRYAADTVFTMAGSWNVHVIAEVDGRVYRAPFSVVVAP